mmetsp:Transcript_22595/g.49318  ORF Transcript_22595/g.49318 Transcript_22595/m.49318 type:complete len:230 (+) Transcript_22595:95-784(+)
MSSIYRSRPSIPMRSFLGVYSVLVGFPQSTASSTSLRWRKPNTKRWNLILKISQGRQSTERCRPRQHTARRLLRRMLLLRLRLSNRNLAKSKTLTSPSHRQMTVKAWRATLGKLWVVNWHSKRFTVRHLDLPIRRGALPRIWPTKSPSCRLFPNTLTLSNCMECRPTSFPVRPMLFWFWKNWKSLWIGRLSDGNRKSRTVYLSASLNHTCPRVHRRSVFDKYVSTWPPP